MASSGSGSLGRGRAAPAAVVADPGLVDLPAADLMSHLIRRNRRASDFVDVALVLTARERRLAEAEARIRAADEGASRLRVEVAARERTAAEAEAKIQAWQRRATEAEARLQALAPGRDEQEGLGGGIGARDDVPWASSPERATGPALPLQPPVLQIELHDEGTTEGRREEAVVSGKRKELVASSEGKGAVEDDGGRTSLRRRPQRLKKLKQWRGRRSNAVSESEANTRDGAEDACEDQYAFALAIVPEVSSPEIGDNGVHGDRDMSEYQVSLENDLLGHDLLENSPEIAAGLETGTKQQGVGQHVLKNETGGEPEGFEPPEHLVAVALVALGNELPLNNGSMEARGTKAAAYAQGSIDFGHELENGALDTEGSDPAAATDSGAGRSAVPEPQASEKITVAAMAANEPPRNKGMFYKLVFKALKEKEMKAALAKTAASSQPNLRCWLYAPLPKDEEGGRGGGS